MPSDRLYNDEALNSTSEWKFQFMNLPPIPGGTKLSIQTTYDKSFGGVGLDNMILHTPQKLV